MIGHDRATVALLDTLTAERAWWNGKAAGPISPRAAEAVVAWWRSSATPSPRGALGTLLRGLRLSAGMTQDDVARRLGGRSQGQVSRWESGDGALPDAGELAAWLDALDAAPEERLDALACAVQDRRV